jgi:hypothetical protein
VEIDREDYGEGTYRSSHNINFTERLVQLIDEGYTTMRLYEWVDRGYGVYLVHIAEEKPGRLARRTLYPLSPTPTPPGAHRRRDTPKRRFLRRVPGVRQRFLEVRQRGRHHTRIR